MRYWNGAAAHLVRTRMKLPPIMLTTSAGDWPLPRAAANARKCPSASRCRHWDVQAYATKGPRWWTAVTAVSCSSVGVKGVLGMGGSFGSGHQAPANLPAGNHTYGVTNVRKTMSLIVR
jgi:hypothetical protein